MVAGLFLILTMKLPLTIAVTPRQVEVVGYLLRLATDELERSPAKRKAASVNLIDIAEARRLNKKLVRAFLKQLKTK